MLKTPQERKEVYTDLIEAVLADPVQSAAAGVWVLQMAQLPHHLLGDCLWPGLPHPERQWIHCAGLSSLSHALGIQLQ